MQKNFTVRLGASEWDEHLGGWRCTALDLPGARVESLHRDGATIDPKNYSVDLKHSLVRWTQAQAPQELLASISITKELVPATWKQRALYVPIIVAIIGALSTLFAANISAPPQDCSTCESKCEDKTCPELTCDCLELKSSLAVARTSASCFQDEKNVYRKAIAKAMGLVESAHKQSGSKSVVMEKLGRANGQLEQVLELNKERCPMDQQ